jgi:signal transduction histidine kinase
MPPEHTILVVDDEPDVVQSVQDLLRLDYRVLGATSAAAGMALLEREEVHVVMTDQRMPETTGVELLRRIRGEHPDAIRLLFTGYADIRAVIDAINQGNVYRYITKPWDPDELQTVIRQAVEQYDLLVERKRLLAELQDKNRALQTANEELRQANRLKEAFIRVASHELRTPLTILNGLTELAQRSPGAEPPLRDWLASIHKAGQRLNRLIDQLIKMLSAGRFERPLERRPTELATLLEQATQDVQPFVVQRKQHLESALATDLGSVSIEPAKIRDSVDNLLLNAIKFTPDGGTIRLAAARTGDGGAEIRVEDTGVGIDADHQRHLFQAFFTGFDVSRHSSGQFEFGRQGLGLGLSLVRAFVEMHGGRVEVRSSPGQGSCFTIFLPAPVLSEGAPA